MVSKQTNGDQVQFQPMIMSSKMIGNRKFFFSIQSYRSNASKEKNGLSPCLIGVLVIVCPTIQIRIEGDNIERKQKTIGTQYWRSINIFMMEKV